MEKKMKAAKILICLLSLLLLFLSAGAGFHPAFAKEKRMRIIIHDRHTVIPKNESRKNIDLLIVLAPAFSERRGGFPPCVCKGKKNENHHPRPAYGHPEK